MIGIGVIIVGMIHFEFAIGMAFLHVVFVWCIFLCFVFAGFVIKSPFVFQIWTAITLFFLETTFAAVF